MLNVAMIPARAGSERLPDKNLHLINNQSLIENSLQLANESNCFDEVYLNADSETFRSHISKVSANFYLRPSYLGSSDTPIDSVINDFLNANQKITRLFLVNPPSQLLNVLDIQKFFTNFIEEDADSMIATTSLLRHARISGKPLNFDPAIPLARTQDLEPIEIFNYSIMAWKADSFLNSYRKNGAGLMCGNFKTFENGMRNFLAIKTSEDFHMMKTLRESDAYGQM
jgi:CMP-N-acetylneuraminic acid synthetase